MVQSQLCQLDLPEKTPGYRVRKPLIQWPKTKLLLAEIGEGLRRTEGVSLGLSFPSPNVHKIIKNVREIWHLEGCFVMLIHVNLSITTYLEAKVNSLATVGNNVRYRIKKKRNCYYFLN